MGSTKQRPALVTQGDAGNANCLAGQSQSNPASIANQDSPLTAAELAAEWHERAAIIMHDGQLSAAAAEYSSMREVMISAGRHGFDEDGARYLVRLAYLTQLHWDEAVL